MHENGSTDTNDGRGQDLLGFQLQRGADLGKKRGDGEPDKERDEETPPRAVVGTHVGAGETAKLDFRGLVSLVGVDVKTVLRVLLPFSLWLSSRCKKVKESIPKDFDSNPSTPSCCAWATHPSIYPSIISWWCWWWCYKDEITRSDSTYGSYSVNFSHFDCLLWFF
jgi:hypothetical protein